MSTDKNKEVKNLEENKDGEFYTRSNDIVFFDGVSFSDYGSSNKKVADLLFNRLEKRRNKSEELIKARDREARISKDNSNERKNDNQTKKELFAQIVSNSKN